MKIISSRKTFVLLSNFRKCSYVVFVFLTVLLQAQQNTNRIASNVIENDNAAIDKSEKGQGELYISGGTVVYDLDNTISAKLIPIHPKKSKKNDRKVVAAKVDKKVRDNPKKRAQSNPKILFRIVSSDNASIFLTSLLSPTNVIFSASNFPFNAISEVEKIWDLVKFEESLVYSDCKECKVLLTKYTKTYSIRPPPKYT